MITRKQYMNKEATHQEYYGQFGQYLVDDVCRHIGKYRILASDDKYFNDIPLRHWDAMRGVVLAIVGRK